MKKIITVFLICFILIPFASAFFIVSGAESQKNSETTFLLCGFDEAALNTDVIILADYSFDDNTISFVHIPRDTYISSSPNCKINAVFPTLISEGKSKGEALSGFGDMLSRSLGTRIDCCIGFSSKAVSGLIDHIGGVNISLPEQITILDTAGAVKEIFPKGETHLDGNSSLVFIRARKGYPRGDLDRIDAQKIFIKGFLDKIRNETNLAEIVKGCVAFKDEWVIEGKLIDLFRMLMINRGRIDNISLRFANLPGLQLEDNKGIWYYSLNRSASDAMFSVLSFPRMSQVDPDAVYLNYNDESFSKVYFGDDIQYKIYDEKSIYDTTIFN